MVAIKIKGVIEQLRLYHFRLQYFRTSRALPFLTMLLTQEPLGQQKKHGVSLASHVSHYLAVVLLLLSLMPPSTLASSCSPFTVSNCTFPQEDIINQFTLPDIDGVGKQVFQNHVNTLSAFLDPNLYALVRIAGQFF